MVWYLIGSRKALYDYMDRDFLDYIMARKDLVVNGDRGYMAALYLSTSQSC